MDIEDKKLTEMLQSWKYQPSQDPEFNRKVRDRIHQKYFSRLQSNRFEGNFFTWLTAIFVRPEYAFLLILAVVLSSFGAATWIHKNNHQNLGKTLPVEYRKLIDPANSVREQIEQTDNFQAISESYAVSRKTLDKALSWIEREVDLDPVQSNQFKRIHEQFYDEFESLYSKLLALENDYRVFERQRVAGEDVDLLSVYENLNSQKQIYQRALQIQQNFIHQVFDILDADQKGKYGELFLKNTPEAIPSAFLLGATSEWKI